MSPNQFNVAFVPFTVVDASGAPRWSAAGRAPAEFLFQRFAIDFAELELKIPYELRAPDLACAVGGRTAAARAVKAADLAERLNADVLIYGAITDGPAEDRLNLAFHVSYGGFEQAAEITGEHPLGGSLPIRLPFDPDELLAIENPPHLVRMDVLSRIVVALSFLSTDNPERALTYLRQAEGNAHWPRVDGKEVVYLLLGNALLRQASVESAGGAAAPAAAAAEAYDAYTTALDIDPAYVRARLGQAAALARIAFGDPAGVSGGQVDWIKLEEAEAAYRTALAGAAGASDARIEPSVHVGLGLIHLIRAISGSAGSLEQAKEEFRWVTDRHEAGDAGAAGCAGNAYGYLGGIARLEGDLTLAIDYYGRAVNLLAPVSQALYLIRLGDLHCQLGDQGAAVSAYSQAIDTARLYGYADQVDAYTAQLDALQAAGCP